VQLDGALGTVERRLRHRVRNVTPTRMLRCSLALAAVERFASERPISLLDAGTGDGIFAIAAARAHPSWRITAADVSPSALERARGRAADLDVAIEFVEHDLTQPLDSARFDCVVALECLSEIEDDSAAIRAFSTSLRPGGLLVLHVPEESWAPVLRSSERTWRYEARHGYSPAALSSQLRAEGLEPDTVRPTTRGTVMLAQELRDRWKDGRSWRLALAYPALASASRLERLGLTWGSARALFVTARRT
jgi:SAM-dependent methyltransferase